jgi:cupin superfamily acireductone dioxygenase involved in methionine salvage
VLQKIMDCHENYDTLLPNGMPSHHHMEDQIIINRKGQQYFQLTNK